MLDNKMRLSSLIELISSKANNILGLLKRNLSWCPKSVKETAYTSLVRPKLQYASRKGTTKSGWLCHGKLRLNDEHDGNAARFKVGHT